MLLSSLRVACHLNTVNGARKHWKFSAEFNVNFLIFWYPICKLPFLPGLGTVRFQLVHTIWAYWLLQ